MGGRRNGCAHRRERNQCWPSLEISCPTSFIRILGTWELQCCLSCSPLGSLIAIFVMYYLWKHLLQTWMGIQCKVCNFSMGLFPLTRIHFPLSLCWLIPPQNPSKVSLNVISFMSPGIVVCSLLLGHSVCCSHLILCRAILCFFLGGWQRAKSLSESNHILLISLNDLKCLAGSILKIEPRLRANEHSKKCNYIEFGHHAIGK